MGEVRVVRMTVDGCESLARHKREWENTRRFCGGGPSGA